MRGDCILTPDTSIPKTGDSIASVSHSAKGEKLVIDDIRHRRADRVIASLSKLVFAQLCDG